MTSLTSKQSHVEAQLASVRSQLSTHHFDPPAAFHTLLNAACPPGSPPSSNRPSANRPGGRAVRSAPTTPAANNKTAAYYKSAAHNGTPPAAGSAPVLIAEAKLTTPGRREQGRWRAFG